MFILRGSKNVITDFCQSSLSLTSCKNSCEKLRNNIISICTSKDMENSPLLSQMLFHLNVILSGKVCIRAKWPIRPELITVSVAWSDWEYFYSPLDGMLVHRRVTPSIKFAGTHLYTWVERGTVGVKCLAQEHNTMSPARAQTRTARSGVERTNHEATAAPFIHSEWCILLFLVKLSCPRWHNKLKYNVQCYRIIRTITCNTCY